MKRVIICLRLLVFKQISQIVPIKIFTLKLKSLFSHQLLNIFKYMMCNKLSIGAYLVGRVKKTVFLLFLFLTVL
jgi:hypothetical protein